MLALGLFKEIPESKSFYLFAEERTEELAELIPISSFEVGLLELAE